MRKLLLCIPFVLALLSFQMRADDNDEKLGKFLDQFRSATVNEIDLGKIDMLENAGDMTLGMIREAHRLVQDTFKFPANGPLEPAQKRILYVYGGKEDTARITFLQDNCPLKLYGLDCSGFIRQLFIGGGVKNFPVQNANTIRQPIFLRTQLQS